MNRRNRPQRVFSVSKRRAIAWQALALFVLVGVGFWLASNAVANLEARRINSGFGFLERPAAIPIGETLIAYAPGDSNLRAAAVGLLNTLLVSAVGIVLATALGVGVGLSRLSRNRLLAGLASVYVEYVRNVPLLAHLFVLYVLLLGLPPLRDAVSLGGVAFLSNRGLAIPTISIAGSWWPVVAVAVMVVAQHFGAKRFVAWMQRRHGRRPAALPWGLTLLVVLAVLAAAAQGGCIDLVLPRADGIAVAGGYLLSPELAALLLGLVAYFGAFIGEIVRGGILAVPPGQWEAGHALGLGRRRVLRLIVLPQALRLIVPPMTNQYLDLAKSSSLAIAIGYPDLVTVMNSVITDTGQAIEAVAVITAAFLAINLCVSAVANWFNARIMPAGR